MYIIINNKCQAGIVQLCSHVLLLLTIVTSTLLFGTYLLQTNCTSLNGGKDYNVKKNILSFVIYILLHKVLLVAFKYLAFQ